MNTERSIEDLAKTARPITRYSDPAIILHWIAAVLVLLTTGLALFREAFSRQAVLMISAHKVAGLCVLAVGLLLLLYRLGHPQPPFPREVERRIVALARSVHWLMCVLMIFAPLAGWIFSSLASETRPLDYRGLNSVPKLWLAVDDAASSIWHEVHELAGFGLIGLFLLHIVGAVRHQIQGTAMLRDRMLLHRPRWLRPIVYLSVFLWLIGLSVDMLGV